MLQALWTTAPRSQLFLFYNARYFLSLWSVVLFAFPKSLFLNLKCVFGMGMVTKHGLNNRRLFVSWMVLWWKQRNIRMALVYCTSKKYTSFSVLLTLLFSYCFNVSTAHSFIWLFDFFSFLVLFFICVSKGNCIQIYC